MLSVTMFRFRGILRPLRSALAASGLWKERRTSPCRERSARVKPMASKVEVSTAVDMRGIVRCLWIIVNLEYYTKKNVVRRN